ncbi:putative Bromodomain testis-specific protein [Durotheca rogersii]|uniref:putative Bromodomain testis-specific protein n=1 Tax=Durotheca rogersii TaxID=419775 RepID=UPI00221FB59A|nr:putative Bromodomain testis-specific protein [Durotheca rogersii]KAI5866751.1 putative Bromodomain testis-specific protein [Durotheca rogersii]
MATQTEANEAPNGAPIEAETTTAPPAFSWKDPHAVFVMIFVGQKESPFGIHMDFLCSKSSFFRSEFSQEKKEKLENLFYLPNTTEEVFGYAQNFMYTGKLFTSEEPTPGYDALIETWKLGRELGIDGLCDETLEAMAECRRITHHIPATPTLVKAWKQSPEGSSMRQLILDWAQEYIRSSECKQEFTKSLPQEVLSELVIAMSHMNSSPVIQVNAATSPASQTQRKNVHYLEGDGSDDEPRVKMPKSHKVNSTERRATSKKSGTSPTAKPTKAKRTSLGSLEEKQYSSDHRLNFCADLLVKMLSGPGFWTRLVGPFRYPVRPVEDGVPDYHDKIKKPMDLNTIKDKMNNREYSSHEEFASDMRQIFANCYIYHTEDSPIWANCQKFEKTFEEKYATMNKWVSKLEGNEGT